MSTLKVSSINNASASSGGLSIDSSGDVTVSSLDVTSAISGALPTPNRNLLYNGAMQVAQRGTSTASIGSDYYTADRWKSVVSGTYGTWTESVENDAPTGSGFRKSLKLLCTAGATINAAASLRIEQLIEGQDCQRIAKGTASAQELTLSFWTKSNVTGTYVVGVFDNTNNRLVSGTYSVSASATWERKVITFPADTTGSLSNDNAAGLVVRFWLVAGTDRTSGTLDATWGTATTANFAVGQTNLAAATNNYWQITGVQLEVGDAATDFEFKSYGQELAECQRYYYLHASGGGVIATGAMLASNVADAVVKFPVTMRGVPTLVATSGTNYYSFYRNAADDLCNSLTIDAAHSNCAGVRNSTEISGTAGHAGTFYIANGAASVAFNAEL